MTEIKKFELEVKELFSYPDPTALPRRFLIIEYEVSKREVNRYEVEVK